MAKYSTGGIGGDPGGACELCGSETSDLRTASVAGATLEVCQDCARHDEASSGGGGDGGDQEERERRRRAARNAARVDDARTGDSSHWERGEVDYEDDPLPYLVPDYGELVESARREAGLQMAELAAELGLEEADVAAVEQGRAARARVGGAVIRALEDHLDVQLAADED